MRSLKVMRLIVLHVVSHAGNAAPSMLHRTCSAVMTCNTAEFPENHTVTLEFSKLKLVYLDG